MTAKRAAAKTGKTSVQDADLSPYEAARRRLLAEKDADRSSRFLEIDMGDPKPIPVFVVAPTVGDRQVYVLHLQPPKAKRNADGSVETEGKGDYTAAKLALLIRCLYFAPEGEEGPAGARLFNDEDLPDLLAMPSPSWLDEPANIAEAYIQGGEDTAEKK